jgi:hypothetical protein
MNIADIKQKVPISEFLKREGFIPVRRSGRELVYRSPYRNDIHPSFTVSDEKGFWYDHGDARGGNIIDLATLLYQTSVKDALGRINSLFDGSNPEPLIIRNENRPDYSEYPKRHVILKVNPLGHNMAIASYLQERGIYEEAVKSGRIKEIYYEYINAEGERRRYFGAGWKNESGGYDVRSKYSKICINRKDVLVMKGHTGKVNIFEGMMNFLSALKEKEASLHDTNFILNTLGLHRKGIIYIKDVQPNEVNLFLDHGEGGDKYTKLFMEEIPIATDKRGLYDGYGDYNEKIMAEISTSRDIGYNR